MSERAKRAAAELTRRGWQMDTSDDSALDKECQRCGYQIRADSRFCQNCGTRVVVGFADGSLADIEAAIAAALLDDDESGCAGVGQARDDVVSDLPPVSSAALVALPDADWTPGATLCYSAEQMISYGLQERAAERERCVALCLDRSADYWHDYKDRASKFRNDARTEAMSDEAALCADAIKKSGS